MFGHAPGDNRRVDHQTTRHFLIENQDAINRQKCFRNTEALIRRIVDGALKPLPGSGKRRVQTGADDMARQGRDPLTPYGIALIRHGRRADLATAKRLFDLADTLEETNVIAELVRRLRHPSEDGQDPTVVLAWIRLPGHQKGALEAHLLCDAAIDVFDFVLISIT